MVQATEQYWMAQVKDLEQQLVQAKARLSELQKDLDSAQLSEQDLLLQLRHLTAKEKAQESALQKALEWDLG
jgi:regulator of replication initiation timing